MIPGPARRGLLATLGPGLMWAAAAIGVSHLVQSTRAGALGGLSLAGIILLALVVKYPFFDYGPRFAAGTGRSLVEGYREIGRWAVWLYLLITVSTAVIVQTAVVLFTSSLFRHVFDLDWSIWVVAAGGGRKIGGVDLGLPGWLDNLLALAAILCIGWLLGKFAKCRFENVS